MKILVKIAAIIIMLAIFAAFQVVPRNYFCFLYLACVLLGYAASKALKAATEYEELKTRAKAAEKYLKRHASSTRR